MATVYTDAIYNTVNLIGYPYNGNAFFSPSASNNVITLNTAGSIAGQPIVGIAYNDADWQAGTALGARTNLTINTYSSGASSGNFCTLTVGVSAASTLQFAVLLASRQAIILNYTGGTLTYAADLSAATRDYSDKNRRRLVTLGYVA